MDRRLLDEATNLYINTYRARPLTLSSEEIEFIVNQYFSRGLSMYKIAKNYNLNYSSVKCALCWIKDTYTNLASKYTSDELESRSIEDSYENIKIYINRNMSKSGIEIMKGIEHNFSLSEAAASRAFHRFMDDWCVPKYSKSDIDDYIIQEV